MARHGDTSAGRAAIAYLFSIDLEDIRMLVPDGQRLRERVPANTERILAFLAEQGVRCTFFTTGDVARRYPWLVRDIVQAGHEIGCHSSDHTPLDRHSPASFADDVRRCRDDLARAGAERVVGFRAPIASLVRETRWAYAVLRDAGFHYSASVLAARSPLYGWPDFGPDRPRFEDGVWEVPVSVSGLPGLKIPFVGGVYFRALPFPLVRFLFRRRLAAGDAVVGYLHPYDIDTEQERFMFPEIGESRLYNWLMYRNRHAVLGRVERLLRTGAAIIPYGEYVARYLAPRSPASHARS